MKEVIRTVHARQILDSRGNPTIEVEISSQHHTVRASVPSGASTGTHEAYELRDHTQAYRGLGVQKAVKNVNQIIAPNILGKDPTQQNEIDKIMLKLDGTLEKKKLGANAILGVSMAVCRLGALSKKVPLYQHVADLTYPGQKQNKRGYQTPLCFFNVINGGKHAGNALSIQECMIVPIAKTHSMRLQVASEIYHTLHQVIMNRYGPNATNVGDEGGFAPPVSSVHEALSLLKRAIKESKYAGKVEIAIDAAASAFYKKGLYAIDQKKMSAVQLQGYYTKLARKYPLFSIEDPFHEESFQDYALLSKSMRVVGDDLTVTNIQRMEIAQINNSCSVLLLKLNQIGTVTEAIAAALFAKKHSWGVMVSHRSGETEDTFIADFAVGTDAEYMKAGAPCRSERTAKYNQLLRIEEEVRST